MRFGIDLGIVVDGRSGEEQHRDVDFDYEHRLWVIWSHCFVETFEDWLFLFMPLCAAASR